MKNIAIVGAGGFGSEVLCCLQDAQKWTRHEMENSVSFYVEEEYLKKDLFMGLKVKALSQLPVDDVEVVVAIADPTERKKIVDKLPSETLYSTIIHPTAVISEWVTLGQGSIVTAGVIITCNIGIGQHAQLNLQTTIGHDCTIGDFFTTAPGVRVSGNCTIGNQVYIGTNGCVREKISISDNAVIGMGAIVVKHIYEPGVYVGNPAVKIK